MVSIIGLVISFIAALIAWIICFLLCEFKNLWCKKDCANCGNWRCKCFPKKGDDHNADD